MIEVQHLVKTFGTLSAVRDVSFRVEKGEFFGFLGPNGAGKTTTINILCTLLAPTGGEATVAGYDVVFQPNQVRKSIGIIFQDPSLDERLTALENLRFHAMLYHLPWKTTKERMEALLSMVGLSERRHDLVKYFSGGMKRRLEIVRGLLHSPKILFMTTHYMEEADQCDRVAIIDHGRLIALDTPGAFKKSMEVETLEDVFLKLTGREIREEDASERDRLRDLHKKWIGRMR